MVKEKDKKQKIIIEENSYGGPKFPYCTVPNTLRKFLGMIPNRPKPQKINWEILQGWGFKNTNDQSILRVLKKLGLLSSSGEPTEYYIEFMKKETGASALGERIKSVYELLFQNVISPERASNDDLTNFFNIHSGGGEKTIRFQIDTFKALAEYANFEKVK